jgi:processive 1,2-diacylglycerol beta-glucosyltransferase
MRPGLSGRFSSWSEAGKVGAMIRLYAYVGEVSEDQLDFLIDNLEEEWSDDRDYFVNKELVEMLEQKGADRGLLNLLRKALGTQDEVDILWVDTEEMDEDEDDDEP